MPVGDAGEGVEVLIVGVMLHSVFRRAVRDRIHGGPGWLVRDTRLPPELHLLAPEAGHLLRLQRTIRDVLDVLPERDLAQLGDRPLEGFPL